jgi:general secretion pathway protein E
MTSFFDRLKSGAAPDKSIVANPAASTVSAERLTVVTARPTVEPALAAVSNTSAHRLGMLIPDGAIEVKGKVPDSASEYAMLLAVSGEATGYLLVLEAQIQGAKVHTLRQHLSTQYQPLHLVPVTADDLSSRRTTADSDSSVAKQTAHQGVSLNVARGYALIEKAIELHASDIHIDVIATGRQAPMVAVRYRVHGSLTEPIIDNTQQGVEYMIQTTRGLYQNDDISPASIRVGGSTLDYPVTKRYESMLKPPVKNAEVRFECMPEKAGFFVVMRLNGYDGKSSARKSLAALGLSEQQQVKLQRAASAPHGLILVVGPTGSGKTTTVSTVLAIDPKARFKRRISLEIPPESDVPWLSQIPTSEKLLEDHSKGVLRSDPDVISGGEIRDPVTAQMANDYALTGHLTFGTFHANGVFPGIVRMLDDHIKGSRGILTMPGFLRASFFQSLVGVLCKDCRLPAIGNLDSDKLDLLKNKFGLKPEKLYVRYLHHGHGTACKTCKGYGIVDRTAAVEVVVPTRSMLKHIAVGNIAQAELEYRQQRTARFDEPGTEGKTYVEHALFKVSQGECCASDIFDLEVLWDYEVIDIPSSPAAPKPTVAAAIAIKPHLATALSQEPA